MRKYSESGTISAVSTSTKTMLTIVAATTTRGRVFDFSFGTQGTPADNCLTYTVQRFTAAGTTTSVTPVALDPGDPAASLSAGSLATVEPTYTSSGVLFTLGVNQRASYRWCAGPEGELVIPATSANGIGIGVLSSSYTGVAGATAMHQE
jgi:hypothetical protein